MIIDYKSYVGGGGQGGHNLPPPRPFCPFVSRLLPFKKKKEKDQKPQFSVKAVGQFAKDEIFTGRFS